MSSPPSSPPAAAAGAANADVDSPLSARAAARRRLVAGLAPAAGDDASDAASSAGLADDVEEDLENDGDPEVDEEEEGEDLLDEAKMAEDYAAIEELDRYDEADLDDGEYEEMTAAERQQAERMISKREAELARQQGRQPAALDTDEDDEADAPKKRRRIRDAEDGEDVDGGAAARAPGVGEGGIVDDDEEADRVDLDAYTGPVSEYLSSEAVRQEIRRRFTLFLHRFREHDHEHDRHSFYYKRVLAMGKNNRTSLIISFNHLTDTSNQGEMIRIAQWIADEPEIILELLNEAAYTYTLHLYPEYKDIAQAVYVRIEHLPVIDHIRDLRQHHLRSFVKVEGVVTRRTSVFPQLQSVKYNCLRCGMILGPYTQNDAQEIKVNPCFQCDSTGPFSINSAETIYRNYQKITLQEAPGTVPAGRVPRTKDIILLNDLIDSVSPGEMVEVTGIYKHTYDRALNQQNGFPVFSTLIIANYIQNHKELIDTHLTEDDMAEIRALAKDPHIADRIFASIGPSIYGHLPIKQALALAMFGGSEKNFDNGHRIRGDINVLLLGDPGTAKSQFLKHVEKIAYRSVYTTGKGASAVGLTASVHRDVLTREWVLEGGALVLADQGVCCIDEFDKMNDTDRTSIHEAMEQQSISISKAGIVTTLKARCAVIAAANPVTGRYNSSVSFAENVELTDAILSRFDLLCVVRDTVDPEMDAALASFVVNSHMTAHPNKDLVPTQTTSDTTPVLPASPFQPIPAALLSKYLYYARAHHHPTLQNIDDHRIADLYAKLRRESFLSGGLPISVRHIESLIRISESHAKMCLHDYVHNDDMSFAMKVMIESFIHQQKFSVMRSLRKGFDPYLSYGADTDTLLLFTLKNMVMEQLQLRELQHRSRQHILHRDETVVDDDEDEDADAQEDGETAAVTAWKKKPVVIQAEDISEKSKELNISEAVLLSFYKSKAFQQAGYSYQPSTKQIIKTL